jgi:hypothetical protein
MAVGDSSELYEYSDGGWKDDGRFTTPRRLQHRFITALSCGSSSSCTIAMGGRDVDGGAGTILQWGGSLPLRTAAGLPPGYSTVETPTELACSGPTVCYLTDPSGTVWVRH